jgi:hypothetical protein
MWTVVFIEPTNEFCGGCHKTEAGPAEKYNECETVVLITEREEKNWYKVKFENRDFFTQQNLNRSNYCVATRDGFTFESKGDAYNRMLYEARGRGDFVRVGSRWIQVEDPDLSSQIGFQRECNFKLERELATIRAERMQFEHERDSLNKTQLK